VTTSEPSATVADDPPIVAAVTTVNIATEVTDELVEAMARLVPQLSSSNPPPSASDLAEIVSSPTTALFVARHTGAVVGTLTLASFRIPTGLRAWIEDVVVDDAARGLGVGEALTQAALEEARRRGALTVDLTSRPTREAANRLYQRVGFEARSTNVYRMNLEGP
jgi:ribosomal protein S18 acetylase RimI-like enzyme